MINECVLEQAQEELVLEKFKLEDRIDTLFKLKQEMQKLSSEKAALQSRIDEAEYLCTTAMSEAGLAQAGTHSCTASIKQVAYPNIKDMERFTEWCVENGMISMIQKRVSTGVFADYFAESNELPDGVDIYDKLTLSIRKK